MALTKWLAPTSRSEIDAEERGSVGWLELFFDLVYVAALIQLGDRLAGDVSWEGVARFAGAFVVLWWTWTGTTVLLNRFAVDDVVHRMLTFAQMFAVGNFAVLVAVDDIDDRSTWLAITYIIARLPLIAMYVRVRRRIPEAREISDLYIRTFGLSLCFWAASLLFDPSVRWWIWGFALLLEFAAPIYGVTRGFGPPTNSHHFQERYALFTIIVLGETFVKTLSEVSEIGVSIETQVFGGLGFAVLIALWWTYYDDVAESEVVQRSWITTSPPANRLVWAYLHLPLAMGLTAFGVAAKKVIGVESFDDPLKDTYAWLLVGALAVVLVSTAVLDSVTISPHFGVRTSAQVFLRLGSAALVLLIGIPLADGTFTALAGLGLVAVVVVAQIVAEVLLATRADRRIVSAVERHLGGEGCEHLAAAGAVSESIQPEEATCRLCDEHDDAWVQLRLCLACGYVGCCDDSPGGHATEHHRLTGHHVIATMEPGDRWAYCYLDDATDPEWWVAERSNVTP